MNMSLVGRQSISCRDELSIYAAIMIDEIDPPSTSGSRFETQRTTAREQIETCCILDYRRQPVEQRFTNRVGRGAKIVRARKANGLAFPPPRNNPETSALML